MDDLRLGRALRAVRVRHGWRQVDLARRARTSASVVSLVERGHPERVSLRALRRITGALEARLFLNLRLPHGELERLLNADHAALHESLARHLDRLPDWIHAPEVSFAIYGERGVIDILAFHPPSGSLLVIELKTELVSLEDLLATMDVRLRHAATIAAQRGWQATLGQCLGRAGGQRCEPAPRRRPPRLAALGVPRRRPAGAGLAATASGASARPVFLG